MNLRRLNKAEHLALTGANEVPDTNRNLISLGIFDFTVHPDAIGSQLGLPPNSIGVKGEEYEVGPVRNRIRKTHDYSFWVHTRETHSNDYIGESVTSFCREIIAPRLETLAKLSESCSIQLQVVQYYYTGCNPGFGLEKEQIQMLSQIGASLDVDIYCLGDD